VAAESRSFQLDRGRIRLGETVFVYLERTLATEAPRSYGLAPAAMLPSGSVVAAVGSGEAIWLGFGAVDPARPATVRVRLDRPEQVDAVTGGPWEEALTDAPPNYLVCPPDYALPGVRRGEAHVPFGVDQKLTVMAHLGTTVLVAVDLVSPAAFESLTGIVPPPLDPDSAFKGYRLP
jgi:hypothetical protein